MTGAFLVIGATMSRDNSFMCDTAKRIAALENAHYAGEWVVHLEYQEY